MNRPVRRDRPVRIAGGALFALAFLLACSRSPEPTAATGLAPIVAAPGAGPAAKAPGPAADPKPSESARPDADPAAPLPEPRPAPLPADFPQFADGEALPADRYVVQATVGGKPANVRLHRATALAGTPCAAETDTTFYSGKSLAGCTLAVDFAVSGLALMAGTEVRFQPDGRFVAFRLRKAQWVKGLPVAADEWIYLTPRFDLTHATLAAPVTVQNLSFPRGSVLDFDASAPEHTLTAAKLGQAMTIGGTPYGAGERLYFDGAGAVVRAVGRARPPRGAPGCPPATQATVAREGTAAAEPLPFDSAKAAGLVPAAPQAPLAANDAIELYFANAALPADFDPRRGKLGRDQTLLLLDVRRLTGRALRIGRYEVSPHDDNDFRVVPTVRLPGGVTLHFNAFLTAGELELTEVTAERVCGSFDLHDGKLRASGTFVLDRAPEPPTAAAPPAK